MPGRLYQCHQNAQYVIHLSFGKIGKSRPLKLAFLALRAVRECRPPPPRTSKLVIATDTSQPHRRRRRSQPERRKSLFDSLQSGGQQLHLDLARGVLQIREDKPGVAGWINSGMPSFNIRVT